MKLRKTNPALFDLIQDLVSERPCDFRKMFGSPAYFVNGNMFAGAFGDDLFLRLSPADREKIMGAHEEVAPFEPRPGRAMKEYVEIPESVFADKEEIRGWIRKSHAFAAGLKPKRKKKKPPKSEG
jgi:TfoX/Sxy family transcriptional regulator of competence genes